MPGIYDISKLPIVLGLLVILTVCQSSVDPDRPDVVAMSVNTNDSVILTCQSSNGSPVLWQSPNNDHICVSGHIADRFLDRFSLVRSPNGGLHSLQISKALVSDAGMYICNEQNGVGHRHFVILVVSASANCEQPMNRPTVPIAATSAFGEPPTSTLGQEQGSLSAAEPGQTSNNFAALLVGLQIAILVAMIANIVFVWKYRRTPGEQEKKPSLL